jgi:hypothetical protein
VRTKFFVNTLQSPPPGCVLNLDAVAEYFGASAWPLGAHLGALFAYLLVMHALTYAGLLRLRPRR